MTVCIKKTAYHEPSLGVGLTATHIFDAAAAHYRARLTGPGGAGEGASSGAGARASAGSAGGSGADVDTGELLIPIPASRTIVVEVGATGVGRVPQAGQNALDGGTSRIIDSEHGTWNAGGGSGGQHETSDNPPYLLTNQNGRPGIGYDPAGKVVGAGQPGGPAIALNLDGWMCAVGGQGASSLRGRALEAVRQYTPGKQQGSDAEGYGAGGGGSVSIDAGDIRGGHASGGEVEIAEYA